MLTSTVWATSPTTWYTIDEKKNVGITVELFLSSTCSYCHKADAFFQALEPRYPWLHVKRYVINEDKNALTYFYQLLSEQKMDDFSVPSIFFCNSRWIGFASLETTGKDLLYAIEYCKHQIEQQGKLTDPTINVLKRWANANLFNSNVVGEPSVVKYIFVVGLMDALSPCSLFCLAGFFALLFMQENRKRQLMVGSLFILVIGCVHYFQQNFASTFFEILPWLRIPAAIAGLFIFYVAGQIYRKRTVNHLFLLVVFLVAFFTLVYQQTCLMNWSYIFEQWLSNQNLPAKQRGLYQFVYQCVYLMPIILTLILYSRVSNFKLFSKLKLRLHTIGILLIMAIGLFLIIYPFALANLAVSLLVVILLTICGWFLSRFNNPGKIGDE